jgi:thymidylate synthase (FAD)
MQSCETLYNQFVNSNHSPQEARSVLPNSLKTEIVCTANIREWRHILKLRTAQTAHPQMRALMIPLLEELKSKLPILFEDIKEEKIK